MILQWVPTPDPTLRHARALAVLLPIVLFGCGEDPDADGDGFAADVDCDDGAVGVYPGAAEYCNGIDDNCDGEVDVGAPARRTGTPTPMKMASGTRRTR